VVIGHVRAGQQLTIALGEQDGGAWLGEIGLQAVGVDAGAVQQVGLGGPAGPAGIATVGGGDQGDQGGDVGGSGRAEGQGAHGAILGRQGPRRK